MPTALQPPTSPPPAGPGPRPLAMRWTVEQFHRVNATGVFEGRRPFLLDGVIWEQGPMNPTHASALYLAGEAIRAIFGTGWVVRVQMPLRVDESNDPFPDLVVCSGKASDFFTAHPVTAALVVEVADTSLREDLTEKAEGYATAGVADYWVLDVINRRMHVLRDPQPLPKGLGATACRTQQVLGPTDRVSPLAAPSASALVGDLLP